MVSDSYQENGQPGQQFRFPCPQCAKRLKAGYDQIDAAVKCPACGHRFEVPMAPLPIFEPLGLAAEVHVQMTPPPHPLPIEPPVPPQSEVDDLEAVSLLSRVSAVLSQLKKRRVLQKELQQLRHSRSNRTHQVDAALLNLAARAWTEAGIQQLPHSAAQALRKLDVMIATINNDIAQLHQRIHDLEVEHQRELQAWTQRGENLRDKHSQACQAHDTALRQNSEASQRLDELLGRLKTGLADAQSDLTRLQAWSPRHSRQEAVSLFQSLPGLLRAAGELITSSMPEIVGAIRHVDATEHLLQQAVLRCQEQDKLLARYDSEKETLACQCHAEQLKAASSIDLAGQRRAELIRRQREQQLCLGGHLYHHAPPEVSTLSEFATVARSMDDLKRTEEQITVVEQQLDR